MTLTTESIMSFDTDLDSHDSHDDRTAVSDHNEPNWLDAAVWTKMAVSINELTTTYNLRVTKYNLYGFKQGVTLLKPLCSEFKIDIIVIQERWLI